MSSRYNVRRASEAFEPRGDWNGPIWSRAETLDICHYMGCEPEHKPKTQAKMLYDEQSIYVIFRVEDRYVRAVARNHLEAVWEDSCVEFFFTPSSDVSKGYFNVETNCGGTMLFRWNYPAGAYTHLSDDQRARVPIYHSEPKIVEPEDQRPTVWVVEYNFPIDILEKYCSIVRPAPQVVWRGNFYKCGDKTSRPHWLTWSVVDWPKPNFHLPQFFGILEFM
jgi:hypothetical protein